MESDEIEYIYIPMMEEFFTNKRKNDALVWIPVPCSLLFSEHFQYLSTPTKYIFVALMLLCGTRGKNEIPFNIKYLAQISGVDRRTMSKAIDELLCAKMLTQRERQKEKKEKKEEDTQTDTRRETPDAENRAVVCDFSKSSKSESENENSTGFKKLTAVPDNGGSKDNLSQFSLAECLSYVQLCAAKGEPIKNPHGLAVSLFQTGQSDAFIRALMFPDEQKQSDLETYGAPRLFSNEPCIVCFGAKMADADGKGYRKCEHCKNERGTATGFEPRKE